MYSYPLFRFEACHLFDQRKKALLLTICREQGFLVFLIISWILPDRNKP